MKKLFIVIFTLLFFKSFGQNKCAIKDALENDLLEDYSLVEYFSTAENVQSNFDAYRYLYNMDLPKSVRNDTELLKSLANDLDKSNYKLREQFDEFPEDVLVWKEIKENPLLALEKITETDNTSWLRFKKSEFFKEITKKGTDFEIAMLNKVKTRSGVEYEKLKELIPDIEQRKLISQMQFCVPGKSPPCSAKGEYFIADQVWIKYDDFDDIEDMIIIDAKLSEGTALTSGQTSAKNHSGKGSLAYKPIDSKIKDENFQDLPTKINQGDEIPILGFYKLFGDGNVNFVGLKKL